MKYRRILIISLVLALVFMMPVMGVTTYLESRPQMSASISGVNEFTAGQDATVTVIVQNSGLSGSKSVDYPCLNNGTCGFSGPIERDDIPTTAKMVVVGLLPGTAPVVIKSDPQAVGDLPSQAKAKVPLLVKILSNATDGDYQIPLTVRYTYLASSNQPAADVLESTYRDVTVTIPLTIKIKPEVKIEVLKAVPEDLNIGTGGYIDLAIKNIGFEDGKKATVKIIRNGVSPIIPTDSSVFVGDFPRDGTVSAKYKVAISGEAEQQTYPVDIAVTYEHRYGDVVTSALETVGIPVGGKINFDIASNPAPVYPGSDTILQVVYKNNGGATAFGAQVRISAVSPFTSSDDSAYLGDLKPGENATARFQMSVDSAADIRNYTLDTQVRYRDALDNSQVSDTFKVPVTVIPTPPVSGVMRLLPVVAVVVLLIVIGAGYYLLVMRNKK